MVSQRTQSAPVADSTGVEVKVDGGVAWLTLNRPRSGNRIDEAAARALCDAAERIEFDDEVTLVVLAARGRTFCTGIVGDGAWERHHDWVEAIGALTRPVIAAINGDAIAEGCELALACDLRIAANSARFCLPQIVEGRFPAHGATQRLPRIIGRTRALDLLLSGRFVSAREALRIGLVTRIVSCPRLKDAAREVAADLARKGPVALRLAKEAVIKGLDLTLEQGIRLEQDLYVLLQTTADREEGIRAFLAKRRPRFRGC